jgi:hypothetical protein
LEKKIVWYYIDHVYRFDWKMIKSKSTSSDFCHLLTFPLYFPGRTSRLSSEQLIGTEAKAKSSGADKFGY